MAKHKHILIPIGVGTLFGLSFLFALTSNENLLDRPQNLGLARRLDDIGNNAKRTRTLSSISTPRDIVVVPHKTVHPILAAKTTIKHRDIGTRTNVASVADVKPKVESALKDVEELSLTLVEAYNAKKFKNPPAPSEFSGKLDIRDGDLESLDVTLPKGEEISIHNSQLAGNTFTYRIDDAEYSGVIFSAGEATGYIVTFSGGPYDQTRLKFMSPDVLAAPKEVVQAAPVPVEDPNRKPSAEEMNEKVQQAGFNFSP